jgi:Domain of unknown function (DUF4271)
LPDTSTYIKTVPSVAPAADTSKATSLFEGHLLEKKTDEPRLHFTNFDYSVAAILFIAFALFVWLYASNRKRLNQVFKGFYMSRFTSQLGRDDLSLGNRVTIFLACLFIITFSLFITQTANYYGYIENITQTGFFMRTAAFIVIAYGAKMLVIRFFGFVFQNQKESNDYSVMIFLFCNMLGMFLLPVVICLAFVVDVSPLVFIYSGLGIFALFLCIRLFKGIIIGFNSVRVSGFYLFLYLCTLEILPFVIGIKLFMMNN